MPRRGLIFFQLGVSFTAGKSRAGTKIPAGSFCGGALTLKTLGRRTKVESGLSHSPLVLGEQPEVRRMLQEFERCGPDRDGHGSSVPKGVGSGLVDLVDVGVSARASKVVLLETQPGLEGMRSRDVRHA